MDDNVRKLDFSEEFLMESAEKRYEEGDLLGALTMLNRRARSFAPSADASALYADIYEALGLYSLCADAWFRFLDTCNEADFAEGYEGLSIAFMNMGDTFQSEVYFRRTYNIEDSEDLFEPERPPLRLVHSDDGSVENAELLRRGIEFIKTGDFDKAQEALSEIEPESRDFPSASGLTAMCLLLRGDVDGAAAECEKMLAYHPENVHALTTYCAVLGAKGDKEGAREVGKRLAKLETESAEDLFRVATALCETGLDEEAYEKLGKLIEYMPYSDDVLWFHAVASYRTGHSEEAISSLERLTLIYPRKAVAEYYLVRMREARDGKGEKLDIGYFYKLPEEEYKTIAAFLLSANGAKQRDAELLSELPELDGYFRLAFDQLDGRDGKMQHLAAKVAVRSRSDAFLREILLDYDLSDDIKFSILCDLILRNEENSFGVVVCSFYREFFIHKVELGEYKRTPFMKAFAEVYSKYALLSEENEDKIIFAAEELYRTLEEADVLDYADEQNEISAVIYREARIRDGERSIDVIAGLFDANVRVVKEILNFII